MKTQGMRHQLECLRRAEGRDYFGYFMEQGTGKTWCAIAEVERFYAAGEIDALLVVAPNGVHTNWVKREFPAHFDGAVIARTYHSGAGKAATAHTEEVLRPRRDGEVLPLRVLAINIEAVVTEKGFDLAERFLLATEAMIVVDESSRIGNIDTKQTKQMLRLRQLAKKVRIATGTPISNSPMRVFSQFEFMQSGLLGTDSYRAFVAEYAELLPASHPLMQHMIEKVRRTKGEGAARAMQHAQMIATNPDGSRRWRNLDKLQRLIEPHTYRVLKRECLDLPEKVYTNHYFNLTPTQAKAYRLMKSEHRVLLEDGPLAVSATAARSKLRQITSGFMHLPDGTTTYLAGDNPRIAALMQLLADCEGESVIVWAQFVEECRAIAAALRVAGVSHVEYRGEIPRAQREDALDAFQAGRSQVFLGQPDAGGIGLTLTAATTAIYFSCDYDLEARQQSEDRCHRIGTKKTVRYIDLVAEGTIDEEIAHSLQVKEVVAAKILGDDARPNFSDNSARTTD
jgi:SNF2 family DNA or RNA helicase